MRAKQLISTALLAIGFCLNSCSDDPVTTPTEFVANDDSFKNFSTWNQTTTPRKGTDPSGFLKTAHEEADTAVMRYIYINNSSATRTNGQYPVGTILVKDMKKNGTSVGVMAMAKRGNNFNKDNNDWEWFVLDNTGKVKDRGVTLASLGAKSGACNACHTGAAKDKDLVFTK